MLSYYIISYYIRLCHIIRYYFILYHIISYLLYYSILHYIILYHIIITLHAIDVFFYSEGSWQPQTMRLPEPVKQYRDVHACFSLYVRTLWSACSCSETNPRVISDCCSAYVYNIYVYNLHTVFGSLSVPSYYIMRVMVNRRSYVCLSPHTVLSVLLVLVITMIC